MSGKVACIKATLAFFEKLAFAESGETQRRPYVRCSCREVIIHINIVLFKFLIIIVLRIVKDIYFPIFSAQKILFIAYDVEIIANEVLKQLIINSITSAADRRILGKKSKIGVKKLKKQEILVS